MEIDLNMPDILLASAVSAWIVNNAATFNSDITTAANTYLAANISTFKGNTGATGLGYSGLTSSTSDTIAIGSTTLTVNQSQGTNAFGTGDRVRVFNTATPTNFMEGLITTYSTTSLTVNVDLVGGSGTFTAWSVSLTGQKGNIAETAIVTGTDLNNFTSYGVYYQPSSANATTALHYPVAGVYGILEVFTISAQVLQRYTEYDNSGVWIRDLYGGVWSDWNQIYPAPVTIIASGSVTIASVTTVAGLIHVTVPSGYDIKQFIVTTSGGAGGIIQVQTYSGTSLGILYLYNISSTNVPIYWRLMSA